MKQMTFADAEYAGKRKQTRKGRSELAPTSSAVFLDYSKKQRLNRKSG
jgi:hypothetical protein